ncbi:hypothetical protein X566_10665 [Afipia sp. P52-10]|uniref:hypothetical protein n=1 Tax=Afipia sp. P52-10 TaxID=1429916 RepID=UPI0003DF156E|nr:hypothetical protein [Afipia sp. P52-10]ETR79059.1 hypothetical protein X566_10665 [Afipia sp. P52-10]
MADDDDAVSGLCEDACCCHAQQQCGEEPLSAEDVKSQQAEVRRKFVNTLVAEVEQLTKLSDEFLSLEKVRKNSTKADAKIIDDEQKALFEAR